jgi:hypothetical protein
MTSAGVVLDPSAIRITASAVSWSTAAFDGHQYVVLWTAGNGIFGARVAVDGTLIDAVPFLVASSTTTTLGGAGVEMASDGHGASLVTYAACPASGPCAVHARLVTTCSTK